MGWLALLLHGVLIAGMALALAGVLARARAGRRGEAPPHVGQAWRDLVRLWRKGGTAPAGASFVFGAAPAVAVGSAGAAALLVPSFTVGMATAGMEDVVVVAGLLGLSRAAVALAAHDAGSAVAVFGGGRMMLARLGATPVVLLVAMALVMLSGGTNLDAAALAVRDGGALARVAGGLAGLAVLAAGQEPAWPMAAFGGRQRALLELAGHLRLVAVVSLTVAVGLPFGLGSGPEGWAVGLACWTLKVGVVGLVAVATGRPGAVVLRGAALLAVAAVMLAVVQGRA